MIVDLPTSALIRAYINTSWDRVEDYKIRGKYSQAIAEEFGILDMEKAYTEAVKREKKEARKGWWRR